MNSCGLVLMAAGASVRLGRPKQLLKYKGKTLLAHAAGIALCLVQMLTCCKMK
jgi:molybdenum cofactor cytidylyltransferase